MFVKSAQSGFSIIEALIYIGLFAFIMSGAIFSAYQIFEGSAQVEAMAQRETELNFVLRKIDWALNGATNVSVINSGNTLRVLRDGGELYDFETDGVAVILKNSGKTFDLSSPRLTISNMNLVLNTASTPNILEFNMFVDGKSIGTTTRYIR
jgi:hypothetical protein